MERIRDIWDTLKKEYLSVQLIFYLASLGLNCGECIFHLHCGLGIFSCGMWTLSCGMRDLIMVPCPGLTEKAMAPHSSTLAWKIPWTEEPRRLQSIESQRVGHYWATSLLFTLKLQTIRRCGSSRKYNMLLDCELSACFCSVTKSCLTLGDPVDRSTPGSSVLHYFPEFAQIHVHWVGDAI